MTRVWLALWVLMAIALIHSYLIYQCAKLVRQLTQRLKALK